MFRFYPLFNIHGFFLLLDMEDPARALLQRFIVRFNGDHHHAFHLTTQDLPDEFGVVEARSQLHGHVPPIVVGEQFQYRRQLQLAGLHNDHIRGICHNNRAATCIVARYPRHNYFDEGVNGIVVGGEGGGISIANQQYNQRLLGHQDFVDGNVCMHENQVYNQLLRLVGYRRIEPGGNNIQNRLRGYEYLGTYIVVGTREQLTDEGFLVYEFVLQPAPVLLPAPELLLLPAN